MTGKSGPARPGAQAPGARWIWVGGLALALAVLAADSARRLNGIQATTDAQVGARLEPEVDPDSRTGYRFNQHRLVLTQTDGYQWLMQAEQEIDGGGLRIREVEYDDAPVGREVHWSGFLRWWGVGVARVYHVGRPELTAPQALEHVAPWANTALLAVFLVVLTPLIAVRLGSVPASLLALGSVAVYPFYDFFGVGYFDHHGVAAMSCLMAVLFLIAAGAGWVRAETGGTQPSSEERALWEWVPTERSARRWFVAAGLAGAAGLWISAAAMAPVPVGIGLGGLVASVVVARPRPARAPWLF